MAKSGDVALRMPFAEVIRKTAGQSTQTVNKGEDVDGPGNGMGSVNAGKS